MSVMGKEAGRSGKPLKRQSLPSDWSLSGTSLLEGRVEVFRNSGSYEGLVSGFHAKTSLHDLNSLECKVPNDLKGREALDTPSPHRTRHSLTEQRCQDGNGRSQKSSICVFAACFVFVVLWMEPRALNLSGKCSTTEPQPEPNFRSTYTLSCPHRVHTDSLKCIISFSFLVTSLPCAFTRPLAITDPPACTFPVCCQLLFSPRQVHPLTIPVFSEGTAIFFPGVNQSCN